VFIANLCCLDVSGWLWWPLGVAVWDHGNESQLESCHGVAGQFYLAHGADLSVEWGLLEEKNRKYVFLAGESRYNGF
jgi:hypothetical protein